MNFLCSTKEKLKELKTRSDIRKQRRDLRHIPNKNDLRVANENAKYLEIYMYETIMNK